MPFVNKLPWKEIADLDIDMWVFWIDLGWYSADMIKDYHKNIPEINLKKADIRVTGPAIFCSANFY